MNTREGRPEYIVCIARVRKEEVGTTWCSLPMVGFTFTSLDHAAYHRLQQGRMVICPECRAAAIQALTS